MRCEEIEALRRHHPAWRLLRADNAPLVLSFLSQVFVEGNARSMAASDLVRRLDDVLYVLSEELGEGAFPRSAASYVSDWSAPGAGWLRKFYPPGATEPYYDATADVERALAWLARRLHAQLLQDDLPRFDAEFNLYLNTNTIRDVAGFQSASRAKLELISERIEVINESLRVIDYNPGRYIKLEAQQTPSVEIRDFRAELRACTDNSLSGGDADQYSEQKFLQVQRIVERFRGRPGQVDADRAWTRRVTDVRNWFIFVASERRHEDDGEHETYSDSSGKSGGQKEKLAYTILAASLASLAYQYKLDYGARVSRTFRFVVIDEAFGRGSDESTRYALRLFRTLGLQLLVVTPLQKIHVIEPFVATVGFVDNRTGSASRLQTLTIEEFRARHARHAFATAGIAVGDLEGS